MVRPRRVCCVKGCPEFTLPGSPRCEAHQLPRETDDRASASERGYDRRWRKARQYYLARHPLCVECQSEGTVRAARHVDHIVPHKGDPALFWDENNWQALCTHHHNAKSAREKREKC